MKTRDLLGFVTPPEQEKMFFDPNAREGRYSALFLGENKAGTRLCEIVLVGIR
jgi:hypothetical protein